ncbi:carbon-nitrogen hydrolase [Candidatus Kapabacteria bacterium]|nr:carbon-nitrogen hydrolase [Candidatus Kapabacteria bacterium]
MKLDLEIVQFEPKLAKTHENIDLMEKYIKGSKANIIVFPELATSGYFYTDKEELSKVAINAEDEIISQFQSMAEDIDKLIVFGFPEEEDSLFYNSAAILTPDREKSSIYRKSHLFYKESLVFEEGNTGFFVVDYEPLNINIGTMICYDWRFPEAARTLALQGADLIICPSNLVTGVWQGVMQARALENSVYVAVANRIGEESKSFEVLKFNGESTIIDPNGLPLVSAGGNNEISIVASIDPDLTRDKSFNEFNDIFEDRRPELYFSDNEEEE